MSSRLPTMPARRPPLGRLEIQVLDTLWARRDPATVKDIQAAFPKLAYTTLMTTLDRLHRKGVLERERRGRAFCYRAHRSREELLAEMTADGIVDLLPTDGSCRPILSMFVEAVGRRDAAMLDELEALVREALERQGRGDGT